MAFGVALSFARSIGRALMREIRHEFSFKGIAGDMFDFDDDYSPGFHKFARATRSAQRTMGRIAGYDLIKFEVQGVDQFIDDLSDIQREVFNDIDRIIRKCVIDLWVELVEENPVDTGRSRAGWVVSSGNPSRHVPDEGKRSYSPDRSSGIPDEGARIHWITNNVEYITVLNDGHSNQAPAGWIDNAVNNFADRLRSALSHSPYLQMY